MCCVKGDKGFKKATETQDYVTAKAARPFTSDTIVWLGKHAEFTSKQSVFTIHYTSFFDTDSFLSFPSLIFSAYNSNNIFLHMN